MGIFYLLVYLFMENRYVNKFKVTCLIVSRSETRLFHTFLDMIMMNIRNDIIV